MKKIINLSIIMLMLLVVLLPLIPLVSANPGNVIWATPSATAVTWGDSFYIHINANIDERISGYGIEYLNFSTAQFNATNVGIGIFFADNGTSATGIGTIDNVTGVIGGSMVDYTYEAAAGGCYQENVNKTLVNLTLIADGVGTGSISFETPDDTGQILAYSGAGKASADHFCNITVHPDSTGNAAATAYNTTRLDLTWTSHYPDRGVDKISVFRNATGNAAYPTYNNGVNIYNSTGSAYSDTALKPDTKYWYSVWTWNNTANLYSLLFQQFHATTNAENSPPTITNPNPTNESDGHFPSDMNPFAGSGASWLATIEDPNGDSFNYSIECSNGNTQSQNGVTNGTKRLVLSNGLDWSTKYDVWVNSTDGNDNSGEWTNKTFWFWTRNNTSPTTASPNPVNNSINQHLAFSWSCDIEDSDGDLISYWINCTNGDFNQGISVANGSRSVSITGLSYSTTYEVYINATDNSGLGHWTRNWFDFTTKANTAPINSNPIPINGAIDQELNPDAYITVNDPEGDGMVIYHRTNATGVWATTGWTGTVYNCTQEFVPGCFDTHSTKYWWSINTTDTYGNWDNDTYYFTTKSNVAPSPPSNPSPANSAPNIPVNTGDMSVDISDPDGDAMTVSFYWASPYSNHTLIQALTSQASGSTVTITKPTGLSPNTKYWWYVNVTDGYLNNSGGNWSFTTRVSTNPNAPSNPSPANHSTGNAISLTLSALISGPNGDDGVTYNATFYWSDGTLIGAHNTISNNTRGSYSVSSLTYLTTYSWYINVSNSEGNWTLGPTWNFTTGAVSDPGVGGGEQYTHTFNIKDITDSPIRNVKIDLAGNILYTDTEGNANFTVGSGTYEYIIFKKGYITQTGTIEITKDDSTEIILRMVTDDIFFLALIAFAVIGILVSIFILPAAWKRLGFILSIIIPVILLIMFEVI